MVILYVDDDAEDCELFSEAIQHINPAIRCITANNGEEAYHFLTNDIVLLPDFIFLDINMPVMDGKRCLSLIKGNQNLMHIPVIMYSTTANSREIESYTRMGARFLVKPANFLQLIDLLRSVLLK